MTETIERPILFSEAMVRALLDGTKIQTRRIIKPPRKAMTKSPVQVFPFIGSDDKPNHEFGLCMDNDRVCNFHVTCPYGKPGDLLWVREAWRTEFRYDKIRPRDLPPEAKIWFDWYKSPLGTLKFCGLDLDAQWVKSKRSRPSIHLPRRFSRIDLEITDVRVQPIQDISEADACAEGVWTSGAAKESGVLDRSAGGSKLGHYQPFKKLWSEINGAESWESNPWVWAITFKLVKS